MARPPEKLAQSLQILRKLQTAEGAGAIRARDLSRTHRERLLRNGFVQEVIKGWYIPSRPDEVKGESTAWYASFWRFCGAYLEARFGVRWCLSPEQSLSLHAGNWTVPGQLAARSPRAGNKVTKLPHGTSLLELRIALPGVAEPEGRGRPAAVLGGISTDRVFPQLFFEQRDGCPRGVADDTGRLRPSPPPP